MTIDWQSTLEAALANEALWDEGVEAARNACAAGAPLASAAITAAAYYDNPLTGGRAMLGAHARFGALPLSIDAWLAGLVPSDDEPAVAGFGFIAPDAQVAVLHTARALATATRGTRVGFWLEHERAVHALAGPLNVAGLCALVFLDANITADEAERRYLLLRLAPALAAAQRARHAGLGSIPFFEEGYDYEGAWPTTSVPAPCDDAELAALKREVGID